MNKKRFTRQALVEKLVKNLKYIGMVLLWVGMAFLFFLSAQGNDIYHLFYGILGVACLTVILIIGMYS